MNEPWLAILALALFLLRPLWLWRLWRAPLKEGEGKFLGIEVEPGFYRQAGATLLRRYRAWLVAPLTLEALILMWLIFSGRRLLAIYEQIPAMVTLSVWLNFTTYQFMERARQLTTAAPAQTTHGVQLSLVPRRLSDHSNWPVEAVIVLLTGLTLLWLAALWLGWLPERPKAGLLKTVVLILYMHAGVLSLLMAFGLWGLLAFRTFKSWWGAEQVESPGLALALITLVVYTFYCVRERRRLAAVEREIRPLELIKEYPPANATPPPEGRFLAGGLFYLNRDNPVAVTRSPRGLAINLANRGAYLWVAYIAGLFWLVVWQVSN